LITGETIIIQRNSLNHLTSYTSPAAQYHA
jgi:hypothetical protein